MMGCKCAPNTRAELEVTGGGLGAPQFLRLGNKRSDYLPSDKEGAVLVNLYRQSCVERFLNLKRINNASACLARNVCSVMPMMANESACIAIFGKYV